MSRTDRRQNAVNWRWALSAVLLSMLPSTIASADVRSVVLAQPAGVTFQSVSVGATSACAVTSKGTIVCWGDGANGILGNGATDDSPVPVVVQDVSKATQVSVGDVAACAVVANGEVWCWGYGGFGHLGQSYSQSGVRPVRIEGIAGAVSVSVGFLHACAVVKVGDVYCWGGNNFGQFNFGVLGDGSVRGSTLAVKVVGLSSATAVSAGGYSTCARLKSGAVACWGMNNFGQLGRGTSCADSCPGNAPSYPQTIDVPKATAVVVGWQSACAVTSTGAVYCWGRNDQGQLGDGSQRDSSRPLKVAGLSAISQVDVGTWHACAVTKAGSAWCWGMDSWGEGFGGLLGSGGQIPGGLSLAPVRVDTGDAVKILATGSHANCLVTNSGSLKCWGWGVSGRLGDGISQFEHASGTPQPISWPPTVGYAVSVSAGGESACAVLKNGRITCWGYGEWGQIGDGFDQHRLRPTMVQGISAARAVSVGAGHACALLLDRSVSCWGSAGDGRLGIGRLDYSPVSLPEAVQGLSNVATIAAGGNHTCASLVDGRVACWGYGVDGQMGNGGFETSDRPVFVRGVSDAVSVTAGGYHNCALRRNGSVLCWGRGTDGQLGGGQFVDSPLPSPVTGLSGVSMVAAGEKSTCAITKSRQLYCWGNGESGELGNGSLVDLARPVRITSSEYFISVTPGVNFTCASDSAGSAWCWGAGHQGQLGDGILQDSMAPVRVSALSNVKAVSANSYLRACAVLTTGGLACWGPGDHGALGNGGRTDVGIPVAVNLWKP